MNYCDSCTYFMSITTEEKSKLQNALDGYCHFFPPTPILTPQGNLISVFPKVFAKSSCGQSKPK